MHVVCVGCWPLAIATIICNGSPDPWQVLAKTTESLYIVARSNALQQKT